MKRHCILLFTALSVFGIAKARDVTREGVVITVPDGEWQRWSGTCTGDVGWSRAGISFSVGTRRYLPKQRDWVSSGDIYEVSSFDDLRREVVASVQRDNARLVRGETIKTKTAADVLVLEFEVEPSRGAPTRDLALYAFREAPDHKSAVEVRCVFIPREAAFGRQLFAEALKSLTEENTQAPDRAAPSVTPPAAQESRP